MSDPQRPLLVAFLGKIFALDPATGKHVWEYRCATTGSAVRLFIEGDQVFAVSGDELACIDHRTGRERWKAEMHNEHGVDSVVVHDGRVFAGGRGVVACFSVDGKYLWSNTFKGEGDGEVALAIGGKIAQADVT